MCHLKLFSLLLAIFFHLSSSTKALDNESDKSTGDIDVTSGTLPPLNEPPNVTKILDGLFKSYDKRLRPLQGGDPVQVYVSLGFLSISHVMEENMEFKGDIYMRQFWKDPRLAYGDKNWTLILQGEVLANLWFPDTYIENSKKTTVHDDTKTVIIFGDGNVFYSVRVTVKAMGLMDFRNYPMDVQLFFFRVLSYGFDMTQIRYSWIDASLYSTDMAEFYVMNQTLQTDKVKYMIGWFEYLDVLFYVRRRFGHYVIRIFSPCILCTVVSWLPFWMNRYEIGERGALGITTLLTEVFLLQYTNDSMPRVSYVKAADLFLIVSFAFTFLALLESVIVYNCKKRAAICQGDGKTGRRRFFRRRNNPGQKEFTEEPDRFTNPDTSQGSTNKNEIPQCSGCSNSKLSNVGISLVTSFKMRLAKSDLSVFVELTSRVLFPVMYIIFVVYFFGKYGM